MQSIRVASGPLRPGVCKLLVGWLQSQKHELHRMVWPELGANKPFFNHNQLNVMKMEHRIPDPAHR